jgi:trypsin
VCFIQPSFAADSKSTLLGPIDGTSKIIGGVEAAPGAWPWIAALLYADVSNTYSAQYCSGVLIEKSWVLTAAHCVQGMSANDIQIAVGAYDLNNFIGSRTPVKRIVVHPQYNSLSLHNDIALIELSYPSYIQKISLFSGQSIDNTPPSLLGRIVTVLGWGLADTATDWYYPTKLRQVGLPVVADSYCNNIYTVDIIPSEFCAGYYDGKDTCDGDSGGPAVLQVDGEWVHAGIISSGAPCQVYNGWYGVYTRTSAHIQFIKQFVPNVSVTKRTILPAINLLLLKPEAVPE